MSSTSDDIKQKDAEQNGGEQEGGEEQGLLSHLFELRDRLLRSVLSILVAFICLFPFSEELYSFLAGPLLAHLPEGTSMIAIDVASPFLVPFKLVLMLAIFIAVPMILYQMWAFVAPGLYKNEKRLVKPLLVSSTALFFCGVAFAYYVVFPLIFGFFTSIAPTGVEVSTDIGRYLDFVITIFFAFGIAFEVPIATILLVAMGVTTPEALARKRPYFIVGAFVIGMILTPPDVISQTLLALPMWLLFEVGIIFSRTLLKKRAGDSPEADDPDGGPGNGSGGGDDSPGGGAGSPAAATSAATNPATKTSTPAAAAGVRTITSEQMIAAAEARNRAAEEADAKAAGDAAVDYGAHSDYVPPSDDELEAELDRLDAEDQLTDAAEQQVEPDREGTQGATASDTADGGSDSSASDEQPGKPG